MKKPFYLLSLPVLLLATSCSKEKAYTCECTYVASASGPNAGRPNKLERESMKARIKSAAEVDCLALEGKYIPQYYSGSCLLK